MTQEKKTAVIIAAAGSGTRMGSGIPKPYIQIGGTPAVVRAVRAFAGQPGIDQIIVAADPKWQEYCAGLVVPLGAETVAGGRERQDSVACGLKALGPEIRRVLVHDGARPYVSGRIIEGVLEALDAHPGKAAAPVVPVKDTIRTRTETLDRSGLFAVQTPQGFPREMLEDAYEKADSCGYRGTDEVSLTERAGYETILTEGAYSNLKITTREDLPAETRVGTGYDVHRLVPGRKLILGGVEIPFEKGLLGHSDADAALHALTDALLGAAALGDIGQQFPPTDLSYKDISSLILLEETGKKLKEEGYVLGNADLTLIAQRPALGRFFPEMKRRIAGALDTDPGRIGLKATTTEGLGFAGREEGIAAQAVCLLYRR